MRVTMEHLYKMVVSVHSQLPTLNGAPDLRLLTDDYLRSVDAGLVGARTAVNGLHSLVRDELRRRELPVFSMPLRPVEDHDPLKNKVDV